MQKVSFIAAGLRLACNERCAALTEIVPPLPIPGARHSYTPPSNSSVQMASNSKEEENHEKAESPNSPPRFSQPDPPVLVPDDAQLVSYTCKNCQKATTDPYSTTCICKKTFCAECKQKESQGRGRLCSTCQEPLTFFRVSEDFRRLPKSVRGCPNARHGCKWMLGQGDGGGDRRRMDEILTAKEHHVQNECRHCPCRHCWSVGRRSRIEGVHKAKCSVAKSKKKKKQLAGDQNSVVPVTRAQKLTAGAQQVGGATCKGCQSVIKKSEKKAHRAACPYVRYKCPYCTASGNYTVITGTHLAKCKGLRTTSEDSFLLNHSTALASSSEKSLISVDSNSSSTTPSAVTSPGSSSLQETACPYSQIGCPTHVVPENLDQHKSECIKEHLDLAMTVVQRLQVTLEQVHVQLAQALHATPHVVVPPCTFRLSNYSQKCQAGEQWFSPAFYSHTGGYKMCLRIDGSGDGDGKGTHTSVFLCLSMGENDSRLAWPFYGKVTVELLNQLEDCNHYTKIISYSEETPHSCGERVMEGERSRTGFGFSTFVSHQRLELDEEASIQYLKDDCLYMRVSRVVVSTVNLPWLTVTS